MDVSIDPGRYLVGFLQWNEQYGSSSSDYDLTLTNNGVTDLLCPDCISDEIQSGNENPIEAICYYNNSNQRVSGKLFVDRVSGSNRRIEMFVLGSGVETEYNVGEGSVFGHSGVPSVLAVGAINAEDSGTDNLAYYSSWGPARVDFPRFESRHKPDLVAIDGVSVTGTGGFPSQFFGTSAAAPHVAGIAALLKQAAPESTPSTLRSALKSSAVDLGTRGDDFLYGAGRVDSIAAVGILQPNFVSDSDSDGIVDAADLFPSDSKESIDSDGDGVGDNADSDDDNDGIADVKDLFPNDSTEHSDQDGDGIGDNSDIDVESELNGNAEQADRITFGMVGQLSSVSDEDWYQIDVDTPGGLVLTFEPEETSSLDYWEVTLEDQIGIVYAAIDTGEAGFFIAGIETSGSYFIVVRDGSAYSHSTASYSIQIESIVDGLDTLETEFNDSSNSSDQLNSQIYGQLYTVDDEDWFYLVISQPTTISVEFEPGESSRLDYWEIALENRKGSVLAALDTGSDGGFSVGIDTIGTYYLVVRDGSAYSHNTATYSLTVSCSSNRVDDSDCDGVENQNDAFPFDLNESEDTDGDGLGNYSDDDDDNDGITDAVELRVGLDPLNPNDVTGSSREILWRHKEAGFNVLWSMESQHRVGLTNLNTVTDPNWVVEGMADFTGDGMDEIFFRHQTTGSNRLWSIEDGFRTSSNVVRGVPLDWFVLAMADFDSDSDADLIWRNRNTGDNSYWEMDGNTRLSSVPIRSVRLDWNMVGTGDFDNDGRNDLLWRSNTGRNVVWLMHGETMSARGELATVMLTWEVVGVGDFDADGMDDILWHESSTGRNSIWLLDGTSRKSRASIPATGVGWHPFGVFDMNGDEMADILWRNNTNGQNRLWLMNGTSRMSSLPIRSVPNKNWQPVAIGNVSN